MIDKNVQFEINYTLGRHYGTMKGYDKYNHAIFINMNQFSELPLFALPQNTPEISYSHVLKEISVNRKDPCEVIRELISNSYDAEATLIEIYPLIATEGFIYFDNGTGLSEKEEINGITPYKAFFSIGKSTKTQGANIGYKCQGSKLCFASRKVTVITKCKRERKWRYISIDNPKDNLNVNYDISSTSTNEPWNIIRKLYETRNETKVTEVISNINQEFFTHKFKQQGTIIIVDKLEVQDFSSFYGSYENTSSKKYSYLKHYIRYNTRHGDMRVLRADNTGFLSDKEVSFKKTRGYNDQCKLYLWCEYEESRTRKKKAQLQEIPMGFPYLEFPSANAKVQIKTPSQLTSLRSGNFVARHAKTFKLGGDEYCLTLAIDGNKRSLDKYDELDRKGRKRSGIRLTDQKGTFISSDGVKICQYNQLFEYSELSKYNVLKIGDAQSHYMFIINGTFQVVTNRNSLTDESLQLLRSKELLSEIKSFLDDFYQKDNVFKELIETLNKEIQATKRNTYVEKFESLKKTIRDRKRFQIKDIEALSDKWIIVPEKGEEHWVGALYIMFAHLVPYNSSQKHLWLLPRTFCGLGLDSLAVEIDENSFAENVHKGLEYKYSFCCDEVYNHPFIVTDCIISWELDQPTNKTSVQDDYDFFGEVSLSDDLKNIGYEIINIESRDNDSHSGTIKVICLEKLLNQTFDIEWKTIPPKTKK